MASYTSASLVEAEIRADNVFSSSTTPTLSQVTTWIEEASREIELRSGEVYTSTTVSSSIFDYDGGGIFRFSEKPLLSIENVEYNIHGTSVSPSWVSLEEGQGKNYMAYLSEGEIEFIGGQEATNKIHPLSGKKKLRLSYTYGFESTPIEIQRLATLLVTKRVIETLLNSQGNTEGGSVTVGTIQVSDPSSFAPNYVKSLNIEIDDLFKNMGKTHKVYVINRLYD